VLDLLMVPPYAPWFIPIEGLFSVVTHNDRFTGGIAEACSPRGQTASTSRLSSAGPPASEKVLI